ncbi:hypothetical protein V3H18_08125 [Methylocystis sp. 9N]|uniref:DUF4402 domain-containing protein n=1 Tax=Methylocystis borbori TaxID=3118750 RepID=A0ABU7XGI2_9HYPH
MMEVVMTKSWLTNPVKRAAALFLALTIVVIPIQRAFSGIASLVITKDAKVIIQPSENDVALVRGNLACSSGDAISISVQITQYHGGLDFDTAAGFTPKPIECPTTNVIDWRVAARCYGTNGCITSGLRDGVALAVATAFTTKGAIAQTTSEVVLKISNETAP